MQNFLVGLFLTFVLGLSLYGAYASGDSAIWRQVGDDINFYESSPRIGVWCYKYYSGGTHFQCVYDNKSWYSDQRDDWEEDKDANAN